MKYFITLILMIIVGSIMFAENENYIVGKWIFETDLKIVTLEIKENNEILYYEQIIENKKVVSENWLEGIYKHKKIKNLKTMNFLLYTIC